MASRILYSSRTSKPRIGGQEPSQLQTTSRATPVISPTEYASRIPVQPSPSVSSLPVLKSRKSSTKNIQSAGTRAQSEVRQEQEALAKSKSVSGIPRASEVRMDKSSMAPTEASSRRNRLRRKASSRDQRSEYARSEASLSSRDYFSQRHTVSEASGDSSLDIFPGDVFGISLPYSSASIAQGQTSSAAPSELATSYSRLQSLATLPPHPISTPELKPPTPNFVRSNSASTRCSESPSPFSRTSTPTSASSYSPAMSSIPKFASKTRQVSPTRSRPPITRRRIGGSGNEDEVTATKGLPALRESMHSASSSSSVRSPEAPTHSTQMAKKKLQKTAPIPPTPPLRISSKQGSRTNVSLDAMIDKQMKPKPDSRLPTKTTQVSQTQPNQSTTKLPKLEIDRSKVFAPPPRPSREGTPILESTRPSPIVQSNLSYLATTGHKRRDSAENLMFSSGKDEDVKSPTTHLPTGASDMSKTAMPLLSVAKQPSVSSPHLVSRETSRSRNPSSTRVDYKSQQSSREPSPAVASPSKSLKRFGLFTQKIKPPLAAMPNNDKPIRKGPTAGTGHEGYGKYARRGRSTSSTSTAASRGRSTSTDRTSFSVTRPASSRKSSFTSNDGKLELDEFLKERLEPVVIGGGGMIRENRNGGLGLYRSESNQGSTSSLDSDYAAVKSYPLLGSCGTSTNASTDNVQPSFGSLSHETGATDVSPTVRSNLAHRRSLHRSQLFGEARTVGIPSPIDTKGLSNSPALETYDSTISSAPPTDASLPLTDFSEASEEKWLKPKKKTHGKIKLTRKWNIFHRSQRSDDSAQEQSVPNNLGAGRKDLTLTASAFGNTRTIAHYAMLDDSEPEGPESLEEALRNIEENLDFEVEEDLGSATELVQMREPSMLLPSPPKFPAQFESLPRTPSTEPTNQNMGSFSGYSTVEPMLESNSSDKSPRLQQVGRIPRVISKKERMHRPSPRSFSRPFIPRIEHIQPVDVPIPAPTAAIERPKLGIRTSPLSTAPFSFTDRKPASAPPTNGMLYNLDGEQEFLRFSPRKDSEMSTSSSSGTISLAQFTAALPTPDGVFSDDEIWDEYDDLLEHVASPTSISPDTPRLFGLSDLFPKPLKANKEMFRGAQDSANTSHTSIDSTEAITPQPYKPALPARPEYLDAPPQTSHYLSSPISLSDLYAGYGSRSSTAKSTIRHSNASTVSGSRYSSQTLLSRSASRSSAHSAHMKRVTQAMAEKTNSTSSDSLRFSALMTSRWLSFDRVLFSPVQDDIRNSRQDRILVVDGLANDDWSTFCALTYPEASIYNLSSITALVKYNSAAEGANSDSWSSPSNLKRISYTSMSAPFPFPKGFFAAVVFRFPAIDTSFAYCNAMSECKRVLRPGGYLECTILDMDMVNMGSVASHAVRSLKLRIQASNPETSLSPTSDEVLKLLGRKGFESISRCIVGVPVTGNLEQSGAGSLDDALEPSSAVSTQRFGDGEHGSQLSLGAMLTGQARGEERVYPVTRMVARVARWWWSKCYESVLLKNVSEMEHKSVWNNSELLQECEERETGLRLVVCYAQKPVAPPRRTMSV